MLYHSPLQGWCKGGKNEDVPADDHFSCSSQARHRKPRPDAFEWSEKLELCKFRFGGDVHASNSHSKSGYECWMKKKMCTTKELQSLNAKHATDCEGYVHKLLKNKKISFKKDRCRCLMAARSHLQCRPEDSDNMTILEMTNYCDASVVLHEGKECFAECDMRSGDCAWCGPGGACCKDHSTGLGCKSYSEILGRKMVCTRSTSYWNHRGPAKPLWENAVGGDFEDLGTESVGFPVPPPYPSPADESVGYPVPPPYPSPADESVGYPVTPPSKSESSVGSSDFFTLDTNTVLIVLFIMGCGFMGYRYGQWQRNAKYEILSDEENKKIEMSTGVTSYQNMTDTE